MKSKWLKVFSLLWLIFVTPVLGLLPFLLLSGLMSPYGDAGRFAVVILRDVRSVAFPDPAPEASHVGFYHLASSSVWWVVVVAVFSISTLPLYYWWRAYARRAA